MGSRWNALWSLLANILYALAQWVLLVVVARQSDPYTLGAFSLVMALAAPVFMATNMRLRFVQSADYGLRWSFADFLRVRIFSVMLAMFLCAGIALGWFADALLTQVMLAVAVFKGVEALQDVFIGAYQQKSRMDLAVVSNLVTGILYISAFSYVFGATGSLAWACMALAAGRAIGLVFLDWPLSRRVAVAGAATYPGALSTPSTTSWQGLIGRAWPLGIVAALDSLNAGIPRYFLSWSAGNSELGIYAAMMHVSFAGFVLVNAAGQSLAPALARHYGQGDREIFMSKSFQLVSVAVLVGVIGIAASWAFGETLVRMLYGQGFVVSRSDFALVMTAGALSYIALAAIFVLSSAQLLRGQMWLYGANTLGAVVAGVLLIPRWGISGAAIAQVFAHSIQVLLSLVLLRQSVGRGKSN